MNINLNTANISLIQLGQADGLGRAVFSAGKGSMRVVTTRDSFTVNADEPGVVKVGDLDNDPAVLLAALVGKLQGDLAEFRRLESDQLEHARMVAGFAKDEAKESETELREFKKDAGRIARALKRNRSPKHRKTLLDALRQLCQ